MASQSQEAAAKATCAATAPSCCWSGLPGDAPGGHRAVAGAAVQPAAVWREEQGRDTILLIVLDLCKGGQAGPRLPPAAASGLEHLQAGRQAGPGRSHVAVAGCLNLRCQREATRMCLKPQHPPTLMVLAPKGPVEPLASRLPSGDSARQAGQVVSSCRPCIVRKHTQCWVFHACGQQGTQLTWLAHTPGLYALATVRACSSTSTCIQKAAACWLAGWLALSRHAPTLMVLSAAAL